VFTPLTRFPHPRLASEGGRSKQLNDRLAAGCRRSHGKDIAQDQMRREISDEPQAAKLPNDIMNDILYLAVPWHDRSGARLKNTPAVHG